MIRQDYKAMLNAKSVIREAFTFATARGKEIGYENVFDYSLGNPSVPAPKEFTDAMIEMLQTENPVTLHGYSPTPGIPEVRATIAESLNISSLTCVSPHQKEYCLIQLTHLAAQKSPSHH